MAKRKLRNEYRPYIKESMYCLIMDVVILAICDTVLLAISIEVPSMWKFAVGVTLIYFVVECFLNYKMAILIFIENKFYKPKEFIARIKSMDTEWSASGKYDSIIDKLYPENIDVYRYKLICVTNDNKRFKVRSAMARNKNTYINTLLNQGKLDNAKITYGPITKIIFEIMLYDKKGKVKERVLLFDNRL